MKSIRRLAKLFAAGVAALILAFSTRADGDIQTTSAPGHPAGAWEVLRGFAPILAGIAAAMLDLFVRFS